MVSTRANQGGSGNNNTGGSSSTNQGAVAAQQGGGGAAASGSNQQNSTIEDLMEIIRDQNEQIRLSNERMNQDILRANQARLAAESARANRNALVAQMRNQKQVYGYANGRMLTPGESSFYDLLIGFGVNVDTADEIFRQGITSVESFKGMKSDNVKSLVYTISKNKSPDCPEPNKVFLGAAFEERLNVLIAWHKFQRITGGQSDAAKWNSTPNAYRDTVERTQFYQEIKESKGTEDIALPESLKAMNKFRDFNDHLISYLRVKRGAVNVPLVYVIRKERAVTDADRNGHVGSRSTDMYKNWDEYGIRCVQMEGTHYNTDNSSFWQILSSLTRDGPGWDYIRDFEKNGDGDGRAAYQALIGQAFQYANIRSIRDTAHTNLENLRYDGPSRHWSFDKYVRAWKKNIADLKSYGGYPGDEKIVSDFCARITDTRLDSAIKDVLKENSPYVEDFDKTQRYFTQCLAIDARREKNRKGKARNVSSTASRSTPSASAKGNKKKAYSGPIEAKSYDDETWHSMSKEQQDAVRKKRKKAAIERQSNKRVKIASASTTTESDDKPPKDAGRQFGRTAHERGGDGDE